MYQQEIESYLKEHRQEMVEDIFTLCRIDSARSEAKEGMPYGEGACEALRTALRMAEGYGFAVRNYENYAGAVDLNTLEKQLDILAHLDVVPAGEGWTVTGPFEPVAKDGKLYGRGTADDKGPAVAALYAMRAVKELGIPLRKNVRLILGTDEECGSSDLRHYYAQEQEAPMTFSPDADFPVVNTEKGNLAGNFTASWEVSEALPRLTSFEAGVRINMVPGNACAVVEGLGVETIAKTAKDVTDWTGIVFRCEEIGAAVQIHAEGAAAHASQPEKGKNALTGLLTLICELPLAPCGQVRALKELCGLMPHGDCSGKALGIEMSDEISGTLSLAFSMLEVDQAGLKGWFDSRCPLCSNEENVLKVVRAKMREKGLEFLTEKMGPPHHVDGGSDFVRVLLKHYEDVTGRKGECLAIGGGTYVHHLKNGVAFGAAMPGTDNRMHGADEFAVEEELMQSAQIFAQVIVDLCR